MSTAVSGEPHPVDSQRGVEHSFGGAGEVLALLGLASIGSHGRHPGERLLQRRRERSHRAAGFEQPRPGPVRVGGQDQNSDRQRRERQQGEQRLEREHDRPASTIVTRPEGRERPIRRTARSGPGPSSRARPGRRSIANPAAAGRRPGSGEKAGSAGRSRSLQRPTVNDTGSGCEGRREQARQRDQQRGDERAIGPGEVHPRSARPPIPSTAA